MRKLIVLLTALGLFGSMAATTCDAKTTANGAGSRASATTGSATRPGHSTVHCDGHRSCDVTLRRATTALYARKLHSTASEVVADLVVDVVACSLLRRSLVTAAACGTAVVFLTTRVIGKLRTAAARHECLRIHFEAPAASTRWRPVSVQPAGDSACVN